ncbi:MAG: type I-B CRISPR-associated protein Cas7/Cst2/DevR [Candidatus Thorarchaeota archaeon]
MKTVQGFVMLDAWASALNNAGVQQSERTDNIVRTKVFWRGRQAYPYVSGQAWRFWWRDTLANKIGWRLSPIERTAKIAYTAANPIEYPDDDMFGYMRAPKKVKSSKGDTGDAVTESGALTRISVLKNSPLISIGPHRPTEDFGTFSRFEGNPVPYEHEFYSTVMKGIFSIDLESAGVFKTVSTAGSQNLPSDYKIPSQYSNVCKLVNGQVVLDRKIRVQRVTDVLRALPHLSGGAMQARHLTRVAPSLVVLGVFSTGSHLLSHLGREKDGHADLHLDSLGQILRDYDSERLSKIFVGREEGFMDHLREPLASLVQSYPDKVSVGTVLEAVNNLCGTLDRLIS